MLRINDRRAEADSPPPASYLSGDTIVRYFSLPVLMGLVLAASACNQSDKRDARRDMHDARDQAKEDLQKAKQDLKQAGRELNKDYKEADRQAERALSDARDKIHKTLRDQNVDRDHKNTDPDKQ